MPTSEANFDGLVGPTHNYAGLSYGNVASTGNAGAVASPRRAARQGLDKMRALAGLGLVQGVLPPQERPDVRFLRRIGFGGTDAQVIERAAKADPTLLAVACSASAMWTANAATVAPSADTADGRVHFVPANLIDKAHRAIEPAQTRRALEAVFRDRARFAVHAPLPASVPFGDEGAANHTRLAPEVGAPGVHLFVHGRRGLAPGPRPERFPARQTLEASEAVARLCGLPAARCVHAQQDPAVIDAGVFHNDVISVGHERWLLHHERAFLDTESVLGALSSVVDGLIALEVPDAAVSVDDAVRSYLFNSQLVRPPGDAAPTLIAPLECEQIEPVRSWIEAHVGDGAPLAAVRYFDLRESMQNGGGPACLRLRVVLSDADRAAVNDRCLIDDATATALEAWVDAHYRDELAPADLADPQLLDESRVALDALTQRLDLGSIYPFQRTP